MTAAYMSIVKGVCGQLCPAIIEGLTKKKVELVLKAWPVTKGRWVECEEKAF